MPVGAVFHDRWRSGQYVGQNKPRQIVRVQRGLLDRKYMAWPNDEDFGEIAGSKHNGAPWQAFWRATGPWIDVPNVLQVDTEEEFDADGIADPASCTIQVENVVYAETVGVVGTYHVFRRGWLAPWYGWQSSLRAGDPRAQQNEWFDVLNGGYRIKIWQGYGDALEPVWTGLIDDTEVTSAPDSITIAARNFGVALTEQRLFGDNKAKEVRSPVIFADRLKSDDVEKKGGSPAASTSDAGNPPKGVLKIGESQFWLSGPSATPSYTQWIQIRIPRGRYQSIFLNPMYDGMEVYISIFARSKGLKKGSKCQIDGENIPEGFVYRGLGNVPGSNGGFPYVKKIPAMNSGGQNVRLGFTLDCGDDTVVRISFRNLGYSPGKGDYRAKVARLVAFRRKQKKEATKSHWILCDDAADVVKWIFMWAGFKEWRVDPMGVHIKNPMVFHQADFMIDVVRHMAKQANYVFYIDRPTDADDSLGVPCFVRNAALAPPGAQIEEVRDADLLTGLQTRFSKETLPYIIRARGKLATSAQGGVALGEDSSKRVQAVYLPPWSGAHHNIATGEYDKNYPFANRLSGIVKHLTHTDPGIETQDEALMACLLIAINGALAAFEGTVTFPGNPGVGLNQQLSVVDLGSGTNTRMWCAKRNSTFRAGRDASWTQTMGGAMIDTPDLLALAFDYLILLNKVVSENGT